MKLAKLPILVMIFTCISYGVFAVQDMNIDIQLSKNDIVTENIELVITSNDTYEIIEFETVLRPLSIIYDGDYSIREGNNYILELEKKITPGLNYVNFTILYDNIIDKHLNERVFRTSFYPQDTEKLRISLTLPTHFVLSERSPSATPRPNHITSDGQRITLFWEFDNPENADLSAFYKGEGSKAIVIASFFISIIIISSAIFFYLRTRLKRHIGEMLSDNELKVVKELKKGVTKQKEIGRNLDFSKSKISKIIKKLEEKNVIEKKPHFKTNIIKLTNKMR